MANKSEILYVKGMNVSDSEEEDEEGDVWDDRKLNDAYDRALRMANAEVAKRVAMSTNNQTRNKEGQVSDKKEKEKSAKGNPSKGKKKVQNKWKAGMPCRAVYEGDGMEYEAFVLRIISDEECVVRFLGYENSEIVSISTLKPTLGTEERTRQIEQALDDKTDETYNQSSNIENMECVSDRMTSPGSTERSFLRKKKAAKKKKTSKPLGDFMLPEMPFPMPRMAGMKDLGSIDMPLPPPPPLSLSGRSDSEEQAISSMLLSWYMSGYYTGLYQGLKRSKDSRRNV